AEVAEGARAVALLDLGVELLGVAGEDGLDEVGEVVAAAAPLRAGLEGLGVGGAEEGLPPVAVDGEEALRAVEDVADLHALLGVGGEAADLEDQLAVVPAVGADQGVR